MSQRFLGHRVNVMKFRSTRGTVSGLSFEEALFTGYAKDGGLLMPERIPTLPTEVLEQWRPLTYHELVLRILRQFVAEEEVSDGDFTDILASCFSKFNIPEVVRVVEVGHGLNVVELFHGPTLAFKDLALSVIASFMEFFLKKTKKRAIILVGTSGDTGGAAIESIKDKDQMDIIVLYPRSRCTQIQELQMTTVMDDNVHVFEVDGTSDDLDVPIKRCFTYPEPSSRYILACINSVNVLRILVQVAHFFYAYFRLSSHSGQVVEIVVPTGAAGNVTAGCVARRMGLPVRLVAMVNENDVIHRAFSAGDYSSSEKVTPTLSSAMDIQVPYNIERLLFLASGENAEITKKLMDAFDRETRVEIPSSVCQEMARMVSCQERVKDDEVLCTINAVYTNYKYIVCPHTAVGLTYHFRNNAEVDVKRGYIATASPEKFPEAVIRAGLQPIGKRLEHLKKLPVRRLTMGKEEDWLQILRRKIADIAAHRASCRT